MKIAILTLPLHTNYGGILQAFALQTVIERMGHQVVVIDKMRKPLIHIPFTVKIKRVLLKFVLRRRIEEIPQIAEYKRLKKRNTNTWKFADRYIHRKELNDVRLIKEGDFDAFVVGSDQIWRRPYIINNFNCIYDAFLGFTKGWNVKRISYAPSFGVGEWEYTKEETSKLKDLLQRFNKLSVREHSGVGLCKENLGIDALQVVDPTMLLTSEDYVSIVKNYPKSKGNLLCYILDMTEEKQKKVKQIARRHHLTPFFVNANVEAEWGTETVSVQPPVEQWIRGFMDAELIVTDSFHACVFSIIFNKRFVVMENLDRGTTRIQSLLDTFGCEPSEQRLINLETFRNYGYDFLNNVLCVR